MPKYVNCPEPFSPLFEIAEQIIEPIFSNIANTPENGTITVDSERYVMYRAESMAIAIKEQLTSVIGPSAGVVIYQIGKATGAADAKFYFEKANIQDPAQRLAMGPVSFAFGGYANVTILPDSIPAPNEDFLLVYDHPNSYEAEAHIKRGITTTSPVDFLNAGYSAGWCSEAFGLKLEAKEISCMAAGAPQCRFVMAPPSKLHQRIKQIKEKYSM